MRAQRALVLVVGLSLCAFAARPAGKRYGVGPLDVHKQVMPLPEAEVTRRLLGLAKMFKLKDISRNGEPVWSSAEPTSPLPALTPAERWGLLAALQREPNDAEVDVLVPGPDGLVPITVVWGTEQTVTLTSGPSLKSIYGPTTTPAELQAKYGVGAFEELDQRWDDTAYAVLDRALSLLSKDDLAMVKGVPFFRARSSGKQRALYTRGNEAPRIKVFDSAFSLDDESFMGPVTAPLPDSVGVVLHELGHAIVDLRLRELSLKGVAEVALAKELKAKGDPKQNAQIDLANALTTGLNRLDDANRAAGGRLAERGFSQTLAPASSPTDYGRRNSGENFAECYRLFKADPEALERISPAALKWFQAGTYRELANQPAN